MSIAESDGKSGEAREPEQAKAPDSAVGRRIEFLRSVRFVFEHPEWIKGLLLLAVCTFIPVLSQPMLFGYVYEVVEHRHCNLPGPYPLFDIRRFAAYVTRGIWCYLLVQLVAPLLIPVFVIALEGGMFASVAIISANRDIGPIIVGVAAPLVLTGLVVFLLVVSICVEPLFMRAGLTQDFAQTFNFRWAIDFVKRMWLQTLLVNVFLWLATAVMMLAGCAFFGIGGPIAGALMSLASGHLTWQLYELYLARGGEPIPLRVHYPTSPKSSASP